MAFELSDMVKTMMNLCYQCSTKKQGSEFLNARKLAKCEWFWLAASEKNIH